MNPMPEKQVDYEEEGYGESQKMQNYGGEANSKLGEDEVVGEDDEYDELYQDIKIGEGFLQFHQSHEAPGPSTATGAVNEVTDEDEEYDELYGDLNIEEGFLQLHLSEATGSSATGAVNEGFQDQKTIVPEPRPLNLVPKDSYIHGVQTDEKYTDSGVQFPDPRDQITAKMVTNTGAINTSQKEIAPDMSCHNAQTLNLGFRGSTHVAQNTGIGPFVQMPPTLSNDNVGMNRQIGNYNPIRPSKENGATMLFVGELHWWTTDVEIESVASKYGRVKEIKFFEEKATGKSKGCCLVKFYDSAAAAACKEGMNGYSFNGRSCTVEFAYPGTIRQMAAFYMNKSQFQPQSRYQPQERRPMNEKGEWARGQGGGSRGSWRMRGTGPLVGSMHPQDHPTYMGRGSSYGVFAGPCFPVMMPPFPKVNAMGIPRVPLHVNPSIFGNGMSARGKGMMMGNAGMDPPHSGMWNDTDMGKWGAEEHRQRPRESGYGGKEVGSEYGFGESSHDKFSKSYVVSREKERASERDRSGNSNKKHRDERDHGRERYDRERYDRERYDRERYHREHRYREEKDDYHIHRRKNRELDYKDDRHGGQGSSRYRRRSRVMEVDHRSRSRSRSSSSSRSRSRSRDADYGKRSAYRRPHAY